MYLNPRSGSCYYRQKGPLSPEHIEVPPPPEDHGRDGIRYQFNQDTGQWELRDVTTQEQRHDRFTTLRKEFHRDSWVYGRIIMWLLSRVKGSLTPEEEAELREILPEAIERRLLRTLDGLPGGPLREDENFSGWGGTK